MTDHKAQPDNPIIDEALELASLLESDKYRRVPYMLRALADDLRFRYQQIRDMANDRNNA